MGSFYLILHDSLKNFPIYYYTINSIRIQVASSYRSDENFIFRSMSSIQSLVFKCSVK